MNTYNNQNYYSNMYMEDMNNLNTITNMYNNMSNMNDMNNIKNTTKGVNNNNNFNKCNYVQEVKPTDLYNAYDGFIRGNMYPDLYNQYKISKPFDVEPMNEQAQLLTYVDVYSFGAHDINLYLDTHPDDKAMIDLYNQYRVESENAIKQYESKFGPLFVSSEATSSYPWTWNNSPWPWENR